MEHRGERRTAEHGVSSGALAVHRRWSLLRTDRQACIGEAVIKPVQATVS